jgi:transcription antitermination factor NusG
MIETFLWYAVYVKSRHEFVTRDELSRKGTETFLPSAKRLRRWKDRKKLVESPLFPGYLFVHIHPDNESYLNVLKVKGVVTLLSLEPGNPTPVPPEEINSLKLLLESGEELDIRPELKEGRRVRIRRGPLEGAEGVLERKESGNILLVNIELLGRSLGVKVYDDDVEMS